MDLDIVHEDDSILVINKPAGLVVHPAAGHAQGTLVSHPFTGTVTESRKSFYRGETFGTILTYFLFFASLYIFCIGALFFYRVRKEVNYVPDFSFKQPLSNFS